MELAGCPQAPCKSAADNPDAARCHFAFVRQRFVPGFLLPAVEGGQAAAAAAYDPSRATFGGKPPVLCARLSEQHTVKPVDGGGELKMTTSGAAELSAEPFCGTQKLSNFTLTFEDVECGKQYVFHSRAVATPVLAGSEPVAAELTFNVTC
jgi:hypothetical protein